MIKQAVVQETSLIEAQMNNITEILDDINLVVDE